MARKSVTSQSIHVALTVVVMNRGHQELCCTAARLMESVVVLYTMVVQTVLLCGGATAGAAPVGAVEGVAV